MRSEDHHWAPVALRPACSGLVRAWAGLVLAGVVGLWCSVAAAGADPQGPPGGPGGPGGLGGGGATVVAVEAARTVDVVTVTLSNGVRCRVMAVPSAEPGGSRRAWVSLRVLVAPTVEGGRGAVAWRAAMAWAVPEGSPRIGRSFSPEGLQLRFQGSADELPAVLATMARMVASPVVDAERLASLRQPSEVVRAGGPELEEWASQVRRMLGGPADEPGPPADARAVGDWLTQTTARAPVEVAIIGGGDLGDVLGAISASLGTLPQRPLAGAGVVAGAPGGAAEVGAGAGGARVEVRGPRPGDGAVWLRGPGPAVSDLEAVREWSVASAGLREELSKWVAERQWGGPAGAGQPLSARGGVWVAVVPGRIVGEPGRVVVSGVIPGDTAAVRVRAGELVEAALAVARRGLEPSLVADRAERAALEAERRLAEGSYWADVLPIAGVYGLDVDALASAPRAYRRLTPDRVNAALRGWALGVERALAAGDGREPRPGQGATLLVQLPAEARADSAEAAVRLGPPGPAGGRGGEPAAGVPSAQPASNPAP